ncbi:hypothetical protein OUS11_001325 [Enterococcus hirae]|nr:hypothetical protein [Enterococcus hirae]
MILLDNLLKKVVQETYPDVKEYKQFHVRIVPKELKSKHGKYIQNDRQIEIYNLSRSPGANFLTALHEVAHHIEAMDLGDTAHKDTFYSRFYPLVCTALRMGYINQDDLLLDSKDSADYDKLCKYYGTSFANEYTKSKCKNVVQVRQAYDSRKLLKRRDFSYYSKKQLWIRKFETEEQAVNEFQILESLEQGLEIQIVNILDLIFVETYYIAVPGAYQYREVLKEKGFIWNGYGHKNVWIKRIASQEYPEICQFLKANRLIGKKVESKF